MAGVFQNDIGAFNVCRCLCGKYGRRYEGFTDFNWIKAGKERTGSLFHPQSVKIIKLEGKKLEHDIIRSVNAYFIAYALVFAVSLLLVSLDNFDFTTNFTAVAATMNNIGPGLSSVGPTCNFSGFSPLSKYIFMFDMLAGRLEVFPMLLLFAPSTWRRQ